MNNINKKIINKKNKIAYFKKNFFTVLIFAIIFFSVINPKSNMDATLNGINIWLTSVLPALLPFFFFTKLLCGLNATHKIGKILSPITNKLYHTDGISGYIYGMSIISGYPLSSKLISEFYDKNIIDYGQAVRICSYTSTSGPLFIIGTVGVGMFHNKTIGLIILISHFLGALFNGLLYRNYKYVKNKKNSNFSVSTLNKNLLENAMYESIKSVAIIGGYIAIFFMLINIINDYNFFYLLTKFFSKVGIDKTIVNAILNGIVEVTRGCLDLSRLNLNASVSSLILTGLISFGGISVFFQAYTFLKNFNMSIKLFFLQKITQSILSVMFCALIIFLVL